MKKQNKIKHFLFISIMAILSILILFNPVSQNVAYAKEYPTYKTDAKANLNQPTQKLYEYLVPNILNVANGEEDKTFFVISDSLLTSWGLKLNYTSTELSKENITIDDVSAAFLAQFEISKMLSAFLNDLPYELYWFDKTVGVSQMTSAMGNNKSITITSLTLLFAVSSDYRSVYYDYESPKVNLTKTAGVSSILNFARQIVQTNEDLTDYEKLLIYKNKICELVSYDDAAAAPGYVNGYSNPWQVVNVFDNNPETNVVCEGYAKAFQLLCNMSTFENQTIKCYTITGTMSGGTGAGPHMWNIVTMDDEKSYLIDVTNSDTGTIGANGELFLVGTAGTAETSYTFDLTSDITYSYNTQSMNLWNTDSDSILNISSSNYEVNHPVIEVSQTDITYNKEEIIAGLQGTSSQVEFAFEGTDYDENDYTWSYEWYTSVYGNLGTKMDSVPMNAGSYFIKVKAVNKTNNAFYYVHSEKVTIDPRELTVESVSTSGREYNGTTLVSVSVVNLIGIKTGDSVSVNIQPLVSVIPNKNVGTYNTVSLSNITLSGASKDNYTISASAENVASNEIEILKTKPTCTETYQTITQDGVTILDANIIITAKGAQDEVVEGTYVWVDKNGLSIAETTLIEKDKTYYYVFTPSNENYEKVMVAVVLFRSETAEEIIKRFFTLENLPTIIVYTLYLLAAIVLITCILKTVKKKRQNRR